MRELRPARIITKAKSQKRDSILYFILFLGTFLRLFRIDALSEFLGDQGRTSLIMRAWMDGGALPLSGPTTLTGQHLGPMFYYLLVPPFLLTGDPLWGSIWMAMLGVVAIWLVYYAAARITGKVWVARLIALLYAVSPLIVTGDRIIWEPNLVPMFGFLFALSVVIQRARVSFFANLLMGISTGILIQLHYPNLFFLGLCGLVWIFHSAKQRKISILTKSIAAWGVGFLITCAPFIWYEMSNGFSDIRGVLEVMMAGSVGLGKRVVLYNAINYSNRIFGLLIPGVSHIMAACILVVWTTYVMARFTFLSLFWFVWFTLGLFFMARYSGVVYDHYLLFLLPPFTLALADVSGFLWSNKRFRIFLVAVVVILSIVHLKKTDIWNAGHHDFARVSAAVDKVQADAGANPFNFTLVSSRSFSDMHYRYYFETANVMTPPITRPLQTLYVICDNTDCPKPKELYMRPLHVICFEPHCKGTYPVINLPNMYQLDKTMPYWWNGNLRGLIYVFQEKIEG